MLKVCNIEQTAPCGFAKLHSSFSVKRGRCRASFSPQGLRQGCSGGAACSSLRGALSRTASFPKRTRSRMRITLSTWLRGRARVYSAVREGVMAITPVPSTTCIEDKDVLFYLVACRSTGWLGWWQDRRGRQVRDRGRHSPRNHGRIRGSLVP